MLLLRHYYVIITISLLHIIMSLLHQDLHCYESIQDSVWFGCLKLLFNIAVKIDRREEPVEIECAYVSFCYEIKLEPSGP